MTTTAKKEYGLQVVRCPHCGRKVAQKLIGEMWVRCSKCKSDLHFIFDKGKVINLN